MIVQCPSCASRYRVNEANIPSTGGRIRCPSCEHAFVVYPEPQPSFEDDADDKTSIIMSPNLHEMMANHENSLKAKKAAKTEPEEEESMTEVMDPSAIPAFSDDLAGNFGAATSHPGDDHTVEMASPGNLTRDLLNFDNDANRLRDDGQTTELTADALKKGLQAAAAARHLAAKADGAAPPPMPLPTPSGLRNTRAPAISKGVDAIPRPSAVSKGVAAVGQTAARPVQSTPQAAPNTLQKLGQRPVQPSFGNLPAADRNASGPGFSPKPSTGRSFGEESVSSSSKPAPGNHFGAGFPAGLGDSDETGVNMMAPVIVSENPASRPVSEHVGPWHLRTNFGLTYEFPDTKGLRSWLSNRDELDGVTLSADGVEFFELSHFPQTQTPYGTGAQPAIDASAGAASLDAVAGLGGQPVSGFGGPQRLTSAPFSTANGQSPGQDFGHTPAQPAATQLDPSSRITPDVYRPQSDGSKLGLLLWPVLVVLVVFALALVLQTLNIVDIKSAVFGAEQAASDGVSEQKIVQESEDVPDPQAELLAQEAERARETRRRDQFDRILLTVEEDINENRLQIASEKLLTARTLEPDNIAVHEMLVDVYTRLGQTQLADDASATLSKLRENPLPPADE